MTKSPDFNHSELKIEQGYVCLLTVKDKNKPDKERMEAAEWLVDNYYKSPIHIKAWNANRANIIGEIEKNKDNRNALRKKGDDDKRVSFRQERRDRTLSCLFEAAEIVSGTNKTEEKEREIKKVGTKLHTLLLQDILGATHRKKSTKAEQGLNKPTGKSEDSEDESLGDGNIIRRTVGITGRDTGNTGWANLEEYAEWREAQETSLDQFENAIDLFNMLKNGVCTQLEGDVIRGYMCGENLVDIAKKHEISRGRARTLKFRAIKKLKRFVDNSIKKIDALRKM